MIRLRQSNADYSFRAWHLVLAVLVMGTTMRYALGSFDIPKHEVNHAAWFGTPTSHSSTDSSNEAAIQTAEAPVIEVLPFDLNGEVPGPLLASILKRYMPESTSNHADELRGTLPPGINPRMIVILPEEDEAGTLY